MRKPWLSYISTNARVEFYIANLSSAFSKSSAWPINQDCGLPGPKTAVFPPARQQGCDARNSDWKHLKTDGGLTCIQLRRPGLYLTEPKAQQQVPIKCAIGNLLGRWAYKKWPCPAPRQHLNLAGFIQRETCNPTTPFWLFLGCSVKPLWV